MDECMHFFNVNMHNTNVIVKHLMPNISNKCQIPLIPKGYRRPILKIKHMTWTYDPKLDPKETLKVILTDIDVNISIFHIYCLATLCITISRSPSSLQALTIVLSSERGDILILLIIRSKFRTKSWSIIFSSSPFGSRDRSFNP